MSETPDPPQNFPIRWLTYRARIRLDVDRAYGEDENDEFFTGNYLANLGTQVKQTDDWLVKLFILQIGLSALSSIFRANTTIGCSPLTLTKFSSSFSLPQSV